MDKLKEKLHIGSNRRKSQPENDVIGGTGNTGTIEENRDSIDSELAAMPPQERVAYLKEFEDSDKHDPPKKGGLLEEAHRPRQQEDRRPDRAGVKEREQREKAHREATHATMGPGAGASAHSAAGSGACKGVRVADDDCERQTAEV